MFVRLISALDQEELVADLVHNFLLPEVEKEIVREKVKLKQKKYLIAAHDEIYNKMETLPKPPPRPTPGMNRRKYIPPFYCLFHI